ncbi:MAG TPA: hypothetical protein PK514_15475 [Spirochaetota bacterium]|nr:hypothetical protein [Spirochaetota bacterium]
MKIKLFILLLAMILPADLFSMAQEPDTLPRVPSFSFSIETGLAVFTGKFRDHLEHDGADEQSPSLDMSFSIFIFNNCGLQGVFANQSVIHPQSKPIEGTIHLEILELFYQREFGRHLLKCYAGIGFQHTTMLLQYYSSGLIEFGGTYGWEFLNERSLIVSVKYRKGILPSKEIDDVYGLSSPDTIESITIYNEPQK